MNKAVRGLCVITVFALMFTCVYAKEYTLKECIDIALENNRDLKQRENSLKEANEKLKQIKGTLFPKASIGGTAKYGSSTDDDVSVAVSANLSYDFYDGGQRTISIKISELAYHQAEENYLGSKQTVIYDVASAYIGILKSESALAIARRSVDYNEEQINLIQARINSGDAAQSDLYPVRSAFANSRVDMLTAQNNARTSKLSLFSVLGVGILDDFEVLPIHLFDNITLPDREEFYKLSVENRRDVKIAEITIDTAKMSLRSTRLSVAPVPTLTGKVSQSLYDYNTVNLSKDTTYELSLGLNWDFFTGGTNTAKVKEKEISIDSVEIAKEELLDTVGYDIDRGYLDIISSEERITAAKEGLSAARVNYEAQNEKYKNGLATVLDLQNAEISLAAAETNLLNAQNDYFLGYLSLYYTAGLIKESLDNDIFLKLENNE